MKTILLAGLDNCVFSATDFINPKENKIIGIATEIKEAWNVYDESGKIKEDIDELPILPFEAAIALEPDCIVMVANTKEDENALTHLICRTGYRGEVVSLFSVSQTISAKTAALRRLARRLDDLGIEGAAADLGTGRGDIAWQMNAMMPERKLYLFDTFSGYDKRDTDREHELDLSDAAPGDCGLTQDEKAHFRERLLGRMPYENMVEIREGWFPETAFSLDDEHYALVHIDTGLYAPTYSGIQYFFPRMSKGGIILVSGYRNGKTQSVYRAVCDLEAKYGAFLITPLCDPDGTVCITRP